ncbi:MAG: phosphoglucosamine mutase [Planctomycetales bacterium]
MTNLIITVSGLRGVVGESLTPEIAVRYVEAFVAGIEKGPILIARDGRANGPLLASAIGDGLVRLGRDVIDADIAATPTAGILVQEYAAAGGIQISASHNPAEYNGIKLFGADGRIIPAASGQRVLDRFADSDLEVCRPVKPGSVSACQDTTSAHWDRIRAIIDVDRIRAVNFKVLLDANHGSGSVLGQRLLDELNCKVVMSGGTPDGQFEHLPEPTAKNLVGILSEVPACGAAIGCCQDPDADRLAVIDEHGRYLGEESTLAMSVDHILRNRKGAVVTNCSTSRMSEDLAGRHGVPFFRTAVGEANVVDAMVLHDAVIGGEGNGGVIDPRVGFVRDSFVGMALLLDAMACRMMPISELADELPQYGMAKQKIPLERSKLEKLLTASKEHFSDARPSELDGLRFDWPGKWLLVRASNTEPIVRIMAEAESVAEAERLCAEVGKLA